jgi:predicted ester cyclase
VCANQGQAHAIDQQARSFVATPTFTSPAGETRMSTAQEASNRATVMRFDDVVSTGDAEVISKAIDELVEPDALIHMPLPIQPTGAQALKQIWAMLLRGLPGLHAAVEDVIAEGGKVVSRKTVTGIHQGECRAFHQPAKPSRTTRSSSSASPMGESRRSGGSSTSSRR